MGGNADGRLLFSIFCFPMEKHWRQDVVIICDVCPSIFISLLFLCQEPPIDWCFDALWERTGNRLLCSRLMFLFDTRESAESRFSSTIFSFCFPMGMHLREVVHFLVSSFYRPRVLSRVGGLSAGKDFRSRLLVVLWLILKQALA